MTLDIAHKKNGMNSNNLMGQRILKEKLSDYAEGMLLKV